MLSKKHIVHFAEACVIIFAISLSACLSFAGPESAGNTFSPETAAATDGFTYEEQLEQTYQNWYGSAPTIDPLPETYLRLATAGTDYSQTYAQQLEQDYQSWVNSGSTIDPLPEKHLRVARSLAPYSQTYQAQLEQGYRNWLSSVPTIDPLPQSFLLSAMNNPNDN